MNFYQRLLVKAIALTCLVSNSYGLDLDAKKIKVETKEKPISVLQKRYFKKSFRPEFGLVFGSLLNEAYTNTETRGLRTALFFGEWVGLELQYQTTSVSSSDDRKALDRLKFLRADLPDDATEEERNTKVSPQPEINRVHSIGDVNILFAPFYGKLNLLNQHILYLDTYFSFGVSSVETDQGNKTAINYSLGQRFYALQSLSFRIDFRNHSYNETSGGKDIRQDTQSWNIGMSWFLF